ncbi:hypothetical protein [Dactylosporangium sp. CA-233914]|uniref:hypothetical protein n=1 Tax=Dactylosporangium sp. CA-233914 TaxID=3239934 RepID=UPI003D8B32A7
MSMHEIEDLVHLSVLALDAHHAEDDDRLRDWFPVLYDFQRGYDCSHTMGRVEDILLRRRHTYRFPIAEHPDYASRREEFDDLTEFTELGEYDEEEPGEGVDEGYVDPPWLYCEAGTALWRRMVDAGRLTGADAVPPRKVALIDVVVAVAEAAEQDGDAELIAGWHGMGYSALLGDSVLDVHDLENHPAVARLRRVMDRSGAWAVELPDGYRPTDDELDALGDELESWWYRSPA